MGVGMASAGRAVVMDVSGAVFMVMEVVVMVPPAFAAPEAVFRVMVFHVAAPANHKVSARLPSLIIQLYNARKKTVNLAENSRKYSIII
jgi:uncharacterized protein (DUF2267 family)